ncbi:MAG: hypothetical protein QNI92_10080 [Desulfobacterales bacterium]|nr:hypothetical protein [Desulfobacterales bacterium]
MEAEILTRPPLSGDYEEHYYAESGNTLWVKFLDEEYIEWCGVFSLGWKSHSSVVKIPNEPVFLVIAGGQGYFVNANTRELISETKWDDIESIIYNEEADVFVITDGLRLGTLKENDLTWVSDRISLDGISLISSNGPIVKGILNDGTDVGCKFEINAVSGEIKSPWLFYENVS